MRISSTGVEGRREVDSTAITPRFARSRRWVGSLLIWVGAGLVGETRPAVELGHEESGLASGLRVRFPS